MKFHVTVSDGDYIKFNEFHMMNSSAARRQLWINQLMMPAIAVLAIAIMYMAGMKRSLLIVETAVLAILSAVFMFRARASMAASVRRSIERMRRDGKLPYSAESDLEFTEEEIIETTESSVQKFRYDEVRLVGETSEHIFVLIGAMQGIILPKVCLNGRVEELVAFMNGKICH